MRDSCSYEKKALHLLTVIIKITYHVQRKE